MQRPRNWPTTSAGTSRTVPRKRPHHRPRARPALGAAQPAVAGLLAALGVVLVLGFAAVTWLWIEARDTAHKERLAKEHAERAEDEARMAHGATNRAFQQAKDSEGVALSALAHLEFDRAMEWCEEGRIHEGLESFIRTVELAEATGSVDLARVARMNLAAWPRELPPAPPRFPTRSNRASRPPPDGKHMVTAGRGSEVHLWDTALRTKVRTYKPLIQTALPANRRHLLDRCHQPRRGDDRRGRERWGHHGLEYRLARTAPRFRCCGRPRGKYLDGCLRPGRLALGERRPDGTQALERRRIEADSTITRDLTAQYDGGDHPRGARLSGREPPLFRRPRGVVREWDARKAIQSAGGTPGAGFRISRSPDAGGRHRSVRYRPDHRLEREQGRAGHQPGQPIQQRHRFR